jgi:hypothetical protein
VNAKTKGNCQKLKKKKRLPLARRRPHLFFEETVSMGARNLVITGYALDAFEYNIPCLQILYSSCQFNISRKSDSSFLSQRGFAR